MDIVFLLRLFTWWVAPVPVRLCMCWSYMVTYQSKFWYPLSTVVVIFWIQIWILLSFFFSSNLQQSLSVSEVARPRRLFCFHFLMFFFLLISAVADAFHKPFKMLLSISNSFFIIIEHDYVLQRFKIRILALLCVYAFFVVKFPFHLPDAFKPMLQRGIALR